MESQIIIAQFFNQTPPETVQAELLEMFTEWASIAIPGFDDEKATYCFLLSLRELLVEADKGEVLTTDFLPVRHWDDPLNSFYNRWRLTTNCPDKRRKAFQLITSIRELFNQVNQAETYEVLATTNF